MIVRVNDSTTYLNMVKYMGGVGTAMSQSEVYTALQQGVIDAERTVREYIQTLSIMKLLSIIHTQSILFILM